jgi:hypothetical protein
MYYKQLFPYNLTIKNKNNGIKNAQGCKYTFYKESIWVNNKSKEAKSHEL